MRTAYEVRIPLRGSPGTGLPGGSELAVATAADREIARQRDAEDQSRADSEGAADQGTRTAPRGAAGRRSARVAPTGRRRSRARATC